MKTVEILKKWVNKKTKWEKNYNSKSQEINYNLFSFNKSSRIQTRF